MKYKKLIIPNSWEKKYDSIIYDDKNIRPEERHFINEDEDLIWIRSLDKNRQMSDIDIGFYSSVYGLVALDKDINPADRWAPNNKLITFHHADLSVVLVKAQQWLNDDEEQIQRDLREYKLNKLLT